MKKVKGDGVEINLAVWEGAGKPILCVHGITANCRCWDVLAGDFEPGISGTRHGFARQGCVG